MNSALLSRCRVIVLEKLSRDDVKQILVRSLGNFGPEISMISDNGSSNFVTTCGGTSAQADDACVSTETDSNIKIKEVAIDFLASMCDGDARTALNGLEMAIQAGRTGDVPIIDLDLVKKGLHRSHVLYDRAGLICLIVLISTYYSFLKYSALQTLSVL